MHQYMPYVYFRWGSTDIDVNRISEELETGYILEVDLEYPKEIYDKHKYLLFAPAHMISKQSKD